MAYTRRIQREKLALFAAELQAINGAPRKRSTKRLLPLPQYIDNFIRKYMRQPTTPRTDMIMELIDKATDSIKSDYVRIPNWGNNLIESVYAIHVPSFGSKEHLKIGWTGDLKKRFKTHLLIVPDCKIASLWMTSHEWLERVALLWAEAKGKRVYGEVFAFEDIDAAITELNGIFAELGIAATRPGADDDVKDWLRRNA